MPQESLRSVVYRSFVTCEDPRGVVEGKTIRISKTTPSKMRSQKTKKEITQSKNSKEQEKMSLVEVKNGAQKLNETIDSWSNSVSFKSQQKDMAKDLLKGALDLQESLMVLGKLQEASCMASFRKLGKQNEDHFSRIGSDRFERFRVYDSDHQKEGKLTNGSSRDCFIELREVIKEGLSKQNLLSPNISIQESALTSTHTEGLAGKKKLHLSPDLSSTSSSRSSSMVYSTHEFTSSESFSSRATDENSKGSNLIAKLMGLEEFPSKPLQKQLDISSKMRPVFDVDSPNAKKQQSFVQKSDREHMSLDEIITMMQSKGVLKTNKREIKQTSKRFTDDTPPIVLMRPQYLDPDNYKIKVYDNPIRKLHQEKAKTEDKNVKNSGKFKLNSSKQKGSVPVVTKPQRKLEVVKKIGNIQKSEPPVKKKPLENAKSTNLVSKNVFLKQVKPQRSVHQNPKSSLVSSPNKLRNQMKSIKTEKPVNEALTKISNEVLQINMSNQDETQDSKVTIKETENVRHQSHNKAFEKDLDHVITCTKQSETRNNHEESVASDVNGQKARILKTITLFQDSEPANFKLFHDCVNEFLDLENQRQNPLIPRSILPSRVCNSEDQMMREIVTKIENIRNYSKFVNESCDEDTVSVLLERDLNLSTIGGAWGTTGWKDGCTVIEIEKTVLDLEKLVLSRLIDEILLELVSKDRFCLQNRVRN